MLKVPRAKLGLGPVTPNDCNLHLGYGFTCHPSFKTESSVAASVVFTNTIEIAQKLETS